MGFGALFSVSISPSAQGSEVTVQIDASGKSAVAAPGLGLDFSQCANGAPPSTDTGCSQGWINGILNPNNSHHVEDQVVPQRFVIDFPGNGGFGQNDHTITFRYQARKGSANSHAYDSLATWNFTQVGLTAANRCDGLSGACPPASFLIGQIPSDPQSVPPVEVGVPSDVTANHMLAAANRLGVIFNGRITAIDVPVHDAPLQVGTDDFATVTVHYDLLAPIPQGGTRVIIMLGGHLGAGVYDATTQPRC